MALSPPRLHLARRQTKLSLSAPSALPSDRRSLLLGSIILPIGPSVLPLRVEAEERAIEIVKPLKWETALEANYGLRPLKEFWTEILAAARSMIGPDFEAQLEFYTP